MKPPGETNGNRADHHVLLWERRLDSRLRKQLLLLFAQVSSVAQRLQVVRALRHRNFRWFWISTTAQAVGRGMQFLILGWLVLVITDSTTQLGVVVFLYGVLNLVFALFGDNL